MFSIKEKQFIASEIEKMLLKLDHPEMAKEKPLFKLHVDGKEKWSWADIEPNWVYEDKEPGINPFNEIPREELDPMDFSEAANFHEECGDRD